MATLPFKLCKCFVANLPWSVGSRELKTHFTKFGRVVQAEVVFDWETGISKGYGFVTFENVAGAEKATEKTEQEIEGGRIFVRRALS